MIDRSRGRATTHKRGLFAVRGVGFLRLAACGAQRCGAAQLRSLGAQRARFNVLGLMVRQAKLACSSR